VPPRGLLRSPTRAAEADGRHDHYIAIKATPFAAGKFRRRFTYDQIVDGGRNHVTGNEFQGEPSRGGSHNAPMEIGDG
jgi:hypothetical protein